MTRQIPRAMFFVDGFNLYHSIERAQKKAPATQLKWLDLNALAQANLLSLGPSEVLVGIHYFTAYAHHLADKDPAKIARHRAYVRALTATGVVEHLGHFKPKDTWIESLGSYHRIWQEKATDVGIVAEVFRQAHLDSFEVAVIVSGDADYAPVVPVFHEMYPQKRLVFAFPYDRKNKELERVAPGSFTLGWEAYAAHQFPRSVMLPSGKFVVCPDLWRSTPSPDPVP